MSNIIAFVRRRDRLKRPRSCERREARTCPRLCFILLESGLLNNETKALWEIYELQASGKIGFADIVDEIEASASGRQERDLRFCARRHISGAQPLITRTAHYSSHPQCLSIGP